VGHADVKNAAAVVGQYQEDVQALEADGRDREEVDGHQSRQVIVQENPPRLRRWSPMAPHVLSDAGLADGDAEFEQFAVDPARGPQRVLSVHSSNQLAYLLWNGWPSTWPAATVPRPKQPNALAMPRDDGGRLDDEER
jgi:hypothetical protein